MLYYYYLIDIFNKVANALIELKKNYESEYCNILMQPLLRLFNLRLLHGDTSIDIVDNVSNNKYINILQ